MSKRMVLYTHVEKSKIDKKNLFLITAFGTISGSFDSEMFDYYKSSPESISEFDVIPLKDARIVGNDGNVTVINHLTVYADQVIASTVQLY